MKALVLTYDRNAEVTRHMLAAYRAVWPGNPFTFLVPFQERPVPSSAGRCVPVPSPPSIRGTVDALLAGLPDEEWVYWCIDDKYPIRLELPRIEPIVRALADGGRDDLSAVLFCRVRQILKKGLLDSGRTSLGGEVLLERSVYHQIWIHQFVRTKVLRHLFAAMPEVLEPAKSMDAHKRRVAKPADHRLWVTETNLAVFGESTVAGVVTENCRESMRAHGIPMPAGQPPEPARTIVIGELPGPGAS